MLQKTTPQITALVDISPSISSLLTAPSENFISAWEKNIK